MEFIDMLGESGYNMVIRLGKGKEGGTPLWWAAMYASKYRDATTTSDQREGALRLVKLLAEKGADVDAVGKDYGKEGTSLW